MMETEKSHFIPAVNPSALIEEDNPMLFAGDTEGDVNDYLRFQKMVPGLLVQRLQVRMAMAVPAFRIKSVQGLSLLDTNSKMKIGRHDSPCWTKGVPTINHNSGNALVEMLS